MDSPGNPFENNLSLVLDRCSTVVIDVLLTNASVAVIICAIETLWMTLLRLGVLSVVVAMLACGK